MTFAQAQVTQHGNNYSVHHGTDNSLFVEFYMEAIHDEEESVKQGRPIYHDKEFIKIIPVGDKNTVVCRPVKNTYDGGMPPDSERWPRQYQAFKNQQVQVNDGTPLEQWAPLTKSQVLLLKAVNVHTVEQLSSVSDTNLHNLGMGARDLRDKAKAYLDSAASGAGAIAMQKENADLRIELEALKNQMKGFMDSMTPKDEDDKPKRGRPPKDAE